MLPGVGSATPEQLAQAFAAAIGRRDVEGALAMWSEDAAILTPDGTALCGRDQIRRALLALIDNGARVRVEIERLHRAGDVALATGSLTLSGEGAAGAFEQRGESTVVYVRGADGQWRIAIDAPWGLPRRSAADTLGSVG